MVGSCGDGDELPGSLKTYFLMSFDASQ